MLNKPSQKAASKGGDSGIKDLSRAAARRQLERSAKRSNKKSSSASLDDANRAHVTATKTPRKSFTGLS